MNYPIILLHTGNPPFLEIAINRLQLQNSAEIILLGDDSNQSIKGVSHYHVKDYFENAQNFEDNYYLHMSSNSYGFELICYQRWFVIEEFIKQHDYKMFWYLDSDVLIYGDLGKYVDSITQGQTFDLIGFDTRFSGKGDSFMPAFNCYSPKLISAFIQFFKDSYTDREIFEILRKKWRKHASQRIPGGICDMTQLKLFFDLNQSKYSIYNSYDLDNKQIPDGNINSEFNYTEKNYKFRMLNGKKRVIVKNFRAYGYLNDGKRVDFIALHFQGKKAKLSMGDYAKENYNPDSVINSIKYALNKSINNTLRPLKNIVKSILK